MELTTITASKARSRPDLHTATQQKKERLLPFMRTYVSSEGCNVILNVTPVAATRTRNEMACCEDAMAVSLVCCRLAKVGTGTTILFVSMIHDINSERGFDFFDQSRGSSRGDFHGSFAPARKRDTLPTKEAKRGRICSRTEMQTRENSKWQFL